MAYPALRIETDRFGPFDFQLGLGLPALEIACVRVQDAHDRFLSSPLAQVVNQLEREVIVASVHGTNTIEGAELSEKDTAAILDLDPDEVRAEQQRRVRNIKDAYDHALDRAVEPGWMLSTRFIRDVHAAISRDLIHADNQPRVIRNNPKSRITYVGDEAHGGRYKPPQFGRDIERLLDALVQWNADLHRAGISPVIRAPLVHLYFERIHPFWDGNGRVGRVLEATLLRQAGFRYAPFALSRFYLANIDQYFALFNQVRKSDEAGRPRPNEPFVAFHLEGMLQTINELHDRVNEMVVDLLVDAHIRTALDDRAINDRQYALIRSIKDANQAMTVEDIRRQPWFRALYGKLTGKTLARDLAGLVSEGLLSLDGKQYRALR